MQGMQQGIGLDVVPGLTLRQDRVFGDRPNAGVDENFEPTLDLFYKVTPALNAAMTINTDFSAVAVDSRQVNLTRFSLFFPEQRDFFYVIQIYSSLEKLVHTASMVLVERATRFCKGQVNKMPGLFFHVVLV